MAEKKSTPARRSATSKRAPKPKVVKLELSEQEKQQIEFSRARQKKREEVLEAINKICQANGMQLKVQSQIVLVDALPQGQG